MSATRFPGLNKNSLKRLTVHDRTLINFYLSYDFSGFIELTVQWMYFKIIEPHHLYLKKLLLNLYNLGMILAIKETSILSVCLP